MQWRDIRWWMKKPTRTAQSYFPTKEETDDRLYRTDRRALRKPNDSYFAAIPIFRDALPGCFVDVGSNTGQSIESMRLFAPDARIIGFEPNADLAAKLVERYRNDRRITIREVGLSDKQTRMELHVTSDRGFVYDGLGSLDYDSAKSWLCSDTVYFFDPSKLAVQSHDCAIETLDMQNIDNPIFIKINVKGAEYSVLKGGIETLRRSEPILLIEALRETPEIDDLLRPLGYEPYDLIGKSFVPGYASGCTFLITRERMAAIRDASARAAVGTLSEAIKGTS